MKTQARFYIWATIVSAIAMFLIAGLAHEVIFEKFFADNTDAKHEGTGIIFLAYLILAIMMVYLFQNTRNGIQAGIPAFVFGAIIGLLWVFPHGLAMAGAHGESIGYEFINGSWHVVEQGLGGWVIGLVHRRFHRDNQKNS